MVRVIYIVMIIFGGFSFSFAQDSPDYMGKGMIQIQPTVAPGYMFAPKVATVYFRADMECYLVDNVSLKTDLYLFSGTNADEEVLKANHSMFLGIFFHKYKGKADFHIGLQPGAAFTKTAILETDVYEPELKVSPILSVTIGTNYYLNKFLHFYCQAQYVYGNHIPKYYERVSLSEIRLSIGVGLNYNFFTKNKERI